jgi:hypothetical protein
MKDNKSIGSNCAHGCHSNLHEKWSNLWIPLCPKDYSYVRGECLVAWSASVSRQTRKTSEVLGLGIAGLNKTHSHRVCPPGALVMFAVKKNWCDTVQQQSCWFRLKPELCRAANTNTKGFETLLSLVCLYARKKWKDSQPYTSTKKVEENLHDHCSLVPPK